MRRVFCSTGALLGRPNGRNFYLLKDYIRSLQCDAYEMMMYDSWYDRADELAHFLSSLSVEIPVWHCEKRIGEKFSLHGPGDWEEALEKFRLNCQLAHFMGAGKMVLHLWDGPVSDSHMENNLSIYPRLLKIAEAHGVTLMVENVVCAQKDPFTHWAELKALCPDAPFILDTKMAAFHQQLDSVYDPEFQPYWQNNIRHLHINDYAGGYKDWENLKTLPVGNGGVDFERFFAHLSFVRYAGDYTVEATAFLPDGSIRLDDLNKTFAYIRSHI